MKNLESRSPERDGNLSENASPSDLSIPSPSSSSSLNLPVIESRGFRIEQKIGSGAFSTIYKAFWDQLERPIACKRIEIESVSEAWKDNCMKMELKIMKRLSHPNIIKVYDMIKTRRFVFIFMDLAENGSIYDIMHNVHKNPKKEGLSERRSKLWFSQLMGALRYCHNLGIAHRDIKLENFLVNADKNALLSDFGFACKTHDRGNEPLIKMTDCGTPEYKAPEIYSPPYDAKAADCYAMGVCLFEMLNFEKPFIAELANNRELMIKAQHSRDYKYRKVIDKDARDLIFHLLDPNPGTRITSENALNHKWLIQS